MRISTPKAFRIDMLIIFNATPVSIYPSDDKKTKKSLFYNHRKSVRNYCIGGLLCISQDGRITLMN